MPEIGISGLPLDYPHSGSAVYVRNLVRELPDTAPDLTYYLFTRWVPPGAYGAGARLHGPLARFNRGAGPVARLDKLSWEVGSLPVGAALRRQSLLHSTYFASPLAAPCPVVVTVHDLVPLLLPDYHRSRQARLYSSLMAWAVPHRSAEVITVSEHARADIVRLLRLPERRVQVTPEAVDSRFHPGQPAPELERVRAKYRLPERFVLYLGGAERRKNLETLVRAWAKAANALTDRELKLVIVARFPPPDLLYPDIPGLVRSLGLQQNILFVPEVQEDDKPALYGSALFFCFPSRYEGFGLPPLEAMASGVPTVCSDATSLPEVTGDGALSLPPDDMQAWSEALVRLADSADQREALVARGLARAARFTWRRTAELTAAVYREVLGR